MKSFAPFIAVTLCLLLSAALSALAYDAPDFDVRVFHADGISLGEAEERELLEALASLASNFPESSQVDDDLREKALGIALRLEPTHFASRSAHRALLKGQLPPPTGYFDSLSAAGEALWGISTRLARARPEPEEKKLAPFLMEISLLVHPNPPEDRMLAFAQLVSENPPPWDEFLTLQAESNPSSKRAKALRLEAKALLAKQVVEPEGEPEGVAALPAAVPMESPSSSATETTPTASTVSPQGSTFPAAVSLPAVVYVEAVEGAVMAGRFSMEVRKPQRSGEREQFPFLETVPPTQYPVIPVLSGRSGPVVEQIEISPALAAERQWDWPAGMIAVIAFSSNRSLPGPRRLSRVQGLLPAAIMMDSMFRELNLNQSFALCGELDSDGLTSILPGGVVEMIEEAEALELPYLLIPDTGLEPLVEHFQSAGDVSLSHPELIAFQSLDEAVTLLTEETPPELVAASEIYEEIRSATERLPFSELAKNEKVQERLREIVEMYPRHLSARAMLEFGLRPIPDEVKIRTAVKRIDEVIAPLLELAGEFAEVDLIQPQLEEIQTSLFQLRSEVPSEVFDYLSSAEDLHLAAERFLSLNNRDTSLAAQRKREFDEALERCRAQRPELGDRSSDDETGAL